MGSWVSSLTNDWPANIPCEQLNAGCTLLPSQVVLVVKNLPGNAGVTGSIPGLGRSPGVGNGNPPSILVWESYGQRSLAGYCLWGVTKSPTRLSMHTRTGVDILSWPWKNTAGTSTKNKTNSSPHGMPTSEDKACTEATWSQSQYLGGQVIMATPIWLLNVSKGMLINAGLRRQSTSNF